MSSTRNNNMPGEYCLEQISNKQEQNYSTYKGKRTNNIYLLPCAGINPAQVPGNVLSKNSIDIESFLLGINSSNLVNPQKSITPQINRIKNVSFYERLQPYLPEPLAIEKYQRPDIFHR